MQLVKFSFIIPIYNVESYLRECLESIVQQEICDSEIILVNDGSTDGSEDICNEYVTKYDNIRLINKPNGGLSDARNVGIKHSSGQYICLIDSDDWIEPDYIQRVSEIIRDCQPDIINIGYINDVEDYQPYIKGNRKISREEGLSAILSDKIIKNYAWANIYKRHLFDGIEYPVGKTYEDKFTTYLLYNKANSIYCLTAPLYHYRTRIGSICNTRDISKQMKGQVDNIEALINQYLFCVHTLSQPMLAHDLLKRINGCAKCCFRTFFKFHSYKKIDELSIQLNRLPNHVLNLETRIYLTFPKLSTHLMSNIYSIFRRHK